MSTSRDYASYDGGYSSTEEIDYPEDEGYTSVEEDDHVHAREEDDFVAGYQFPRKLKFCKVLLLPPRRKIPDVKPKITGDDCPICLQVTCMSPDQELVYCSHVCGHAFHTACAIRYAPKYMERLIKCPICRQMTQFKAVAKILDV